jgi:hypothetical protein
LRSEPVRWQDKCRMLRKDNSTQEVFLQEQVDSLLLPVVQSYEDKQTQLRMDSFVTMTHRFAKIRSKRLQAAVSAVAGAPLDEELALHSDSSAGAKRTLENGMGGLGQGKKRAAQEVSGVDREGGSRKSTRRPGLRGAGGANAAGEDADVAGRVGEDRSGGEECVDDWDYEGEAVDPSFAQYLY